MKIQLLCGSYFVQRQQYLQKHKRISEYDSENLLYAVIETILQTEQFSKVGCAVHISLSTIVRDYSILSEDEVKYARNPLTHTDFLLFNKMDRSPILSIEVDGTSYHAADTMQAARDELKNSIFEKIGIPLIRIRTNESGEKARIISKLQQII